MGRRVRAVIRPGTSTPAPTSDGSLASGRNGRDDRGQAALTMAGRRQRRRGPRPAGPIKAEHGRSPQAHAQPGQEAGLLARDHRYRQAPLVLYFSSGSLYSTNKVSVETTRPRTRISRRGGANARCSSSSHRGRHTASCRLMLPFTTPSTSNVTSSPAEP